MAKNEALGKGMGALISASRKGGPQFEAEPQMLKSEAHSTEYAVQTTKSDIPTTESEVQTQATEVQSTDAEVHSADNSLQSSAFVDPKILDQAIEESKKFPKVTIWSPMAMAVLRYRQLTTIRYSMSGESRLKLEEALKEAYPALWAEVEKRIEKGVSN